MNKTDKAEYKGKQWNEVREKAQTLANKNSATYYAFPDYDGTIAIEIDYPKSGVQFETFNPVTDPRTVAGKYPEATVENALSEIKRLIGWLDYVREDEYSDVERQRIIAVSIRFAKIAQPIASKYND